MAADWFEIIEGRTLEQGDLLIGCPVYRPLLTGPVVPDQEVPLVANILDLIIISQSCDLVEGQKASIQEVLLCPAPTLGEAMRSPAHPLAKSENRKYLADFKLTAFHPLKETRQPGCSRDFSVVHFAQAQSLPLGYAREFAANRGPRLRLKSPYRELLAQRFAYFFGRIALPEILKLPEL